MNDPDTYHAFMLDYAAGNLSESMAIAATIHRMMSHRGAEAAQVWNAVRTSLAPACLYLDGASDPTEHFEKTASDIIHTDYGSVSWKRGLSGARTARLDDSQGSLMRLEPGDRVFSHGHSTLEAMIVLEGALDDGRAVFEAGDLVLATPGIRHRPSAAGNTACTCFVARADTPFWRFT